MLSADAEKALEEAFLGTESAAPMSYEDYFMASRTRTTGLDEVERFLQSSADGDSAAADLSAGAKRAIMKKRSSLYASPRAIRPTAMAPSSSSSSSFSSSVLTDDRPFHERMAEARRRYQQLTRERNAPKQQSWGGQGQGKNEAAGATKTRTIRSEVKRSYTFQAIRRPSAAVTEISNTEEASRQAMDKNEKTTGEHATTKMEGVETNGKRQKVEENGEEEEKGKELINEGASEQQPIGLEGESEDGVGCQMEEDGQVGRETKGDARKMVKAQRHAIASGPREKYSELRLEGGIEADLMAGYMEGKKIVHLSNIMQHRRADGFKNISGNWVTFGILVDKSELREASKGKSKYMAWDLADLKGNMISLFLFGEAAIYFAHEAQGNLFAFLNPEIIDARGGMSIALTVNEPTQVLKVGKAVDFGICSAVENGHPCTAVIDKSVRKRCIYHMQSEYSKVRSSRGELNSVISSPASRTTLKEAKARSQNNLSNAIFFLDGLELRPRAYAAAMAHRKTAKQGRDDGGSELLSSPEIRALLTNARDTAGARNLKRMLGLSEQTDARSHKSLKLIKQRMRKSGANVGAIHPNHPILLRSEEEWEQEELSTKEKREKGKRKAPEEGEEQDGCDNQTVNAAARTIEAGNEEGPAKKRRRTAAAADGDGNGGLVAVAADRSDCAAAGEGTPQLARGYRPGDSIVL